MQKHLISLITMIVVITAVVGCAQPGAATPAPTQENLFGVSAGNRLQPHNPPMFANRSDGLAFRCYTLNGCKGNYTPDVISEQECGSRGGNSWTDKTGKCVSNIGD